VTALLSAAGRAFLRAFLASILVLSVGVFAAPDLNRMRLLGVAALLGSLVAGIRAVQAYRPKFSLVAYLGHPFGDWADSFLHAFVAALLTMTIGILGAPDLHTARAFAVAGILGAFNAGVRALQGFLTANEHPSPGIGVAEPGQP
jgi:hypothetical protein